MGRRKDFLDEYDSDSSSAGSDADDIVPTDDGGHRSKRRRTTKANAREFAALGVFGSESEDERPGLGGWKKKNLRGHKMGFVGAGEKVDDDEDEEEVEGIRDRIGEGGGGGLGFNKAAEEKDEPWQEEEVEDGSFQEPPYEEEEEEEPWEEEPAPRLGLGLGAGRGGRMMAFSKFTKAGLGVGAGSGSGNNNSSAPPSGTSTPRSMDGHPGLGFGRTSAAAAVAATPTPTPTGPSTPAFNAATFASPFGPGFVSSAAKAAATMPQLSAMPPPNGETPVVRPSAFATPAPHSGHRGKKATAQDASSAAVNPNSFAARMMAKMGYKAGQGLGKEGQGRLEPVAPKLRPQGAGVGAVREMSEQEKRESRKQRALKGEVLSDSDSEKERKARRKKKRQSGVSAGSTPGGTPRSGKKKEKMKFRTAEEISAEAKGLEVPNTLKSIIDFTGKEQKLLTSAQGLMQVGKADSENLKLAKMARKDLESFASEWKGLQDRKVYISKEEMRLTDVMDEQAKGIKRMQEMVDISKKLQTLSLERTSGDDDDEVVEALVSQLEVLQFEFDAEIASHELADLAVGALGPHFRADIASWDPLADPLYFRDHFLRLRPLLAIRTREDLEEIYARDGFIPRAKLASPYEALLSTVWLPRVRATINNSWDAHDSTPALTLLDLWMPVLPSWIYISVFTQLILPKLTAAINAWNPRPPRKNHTPPPPPPPAPHLWIFPWLPHLSSHLSQLLPTLRSKLSTVLSTHPIVSPPPEGLELWSSLFPLEPLLLRHLLPRLATHLHDHLTINPADQDLSPLEAVLAYTPLFSPHTVAKLLEAEFFPQWLSVLHAWLTSESVALGEVHQWYVFWTDVLSASQNEGVKAGFRKGLDMMNDALDLGPRAATELPPPVSGPVKLIPSTTTTTTTKPLTEEALKKEKTKKKVEIPETTFRDVVEDWCVEKNLLLVPLRKAHMKTGSPLFRITASASGGGVGGGGGVVVYFRGDVVWAQSAKDRERWEPVGLGSIAERLEV